MTLGSVLIMENYGKAIDWQDTTSTIRLGTLGSDFIAERVVVIDFMKQALRIFADRPDWMQELPNFTPFEFRGRRILLPANMAGRERLLLYDSGCSAFGLLTSRRRFRKYADASAEDVTYDASNWGTSWPVHHKPSRTLLRLGGNEVPLRRISYVDLYAGWQHFMTPFTRIGGFLGNQPFLEASLILDARREEFLVVQGTIEEWEVAP